MRNVTLGSTGITVPQNAFGALPIQRVSVEEAVRLLREAYEGGMRLFDTARVYSDSEEKVGIAFEGMRDKVYITTKTQAKNPEDFRKDLDTSLRMLRTDYIDVYQLHCAPSKDWLTEYWQTEMKKIENCIGCRKCTEKCPYSLDTPNLLKKNYEDYKKVLSGETKV